MNSPSEIKLENGKDITFSFNRNYWMKLDENDRLIKSLTFLMEHLNISNTSISSTKILKIQNKNVSKNTLELEKTILFFSKEKSKLDGFKIVFIFIEIPETFSLKVVGGVKKEVFEKNLTLKIDSDQQRFLYRIPLLIFNKETIGIEKESNHRLSLYHLSDIQLVSFLEKPNDILELLKRNFELINGKGNGLLLSNETKDLISRHKKMIPEVIDHHDLCPLCMDFTLSFFYLSFRFFRNSNFDLKLQNHMESIIQAIDLNIGDDDNSNNDHNQESLSNLIKYYLENDLHNQFSIVEVSPGSIPVLDISKTTLIIKLHHLHFLDLLTFFPIWKGKIIINTSIGNQFKTFKVFLQKRWISNLGKRIFERDLEFSLKVLKPSENGIDSEIDTLVSKLGFKKLSPLGLSSSNFSSSQKKKIWIPETLPSLSEVIESNSSPDGDLFPQCIRELITKIKKNGPTYSLRKASRSLADLGFENDEILKLYETHAGTKPERVKQTSAHLLDESSIPEIESLKRLNDSPDEFSSERDFKTLGSRCEKIIQEPVSEDGFYCPFNDPFFLKSEKLLEIEDMGFLTDPLSKCSRYFSYVSGLNYPRTHKSPTVYFLHRLQEIEKKKEMN